MSPADAARRALESLIVAHRVGERQAMIDTRRQLKAALRDIARAAHREELPEESRRVELFSDPAATRAAIAAVTALRLSYGDQDPWLLREYQRLLEEELLVDPPAAVMALLGIASLLMGDSMTPVAYALSRLSDGPQ